jgi:phosphoglycerate dehydrogenase-like enzyme
MTALLLERLHPEAEALLAATHDVWLGEDERTIARAPFERVCAILTRGRGRISRALLERCPRLQVVARAGVGLDNVDLASAARLGIPVLFAPGSNAATTAEHAIALLLALTRRVASSARAVATGRWEERARYAGDEAHGKTLGIVGFGQIGRRVAAIAEALGMQVVVAAHPSVSTDHAQLPLAELLARCDFVSLHLPLTPRTRGLLGAAELAAMKPTACLINTARGALVDQRALLAALAAGRLGGFAADVLDGEPPAPDDPLLAQEHVLLTPHVAALTASTYRATCLRIASNVLSVLRGERPDEGCVHR